MKNPKTKTKPPEAELIRAPGSLRDPAGQVYFSGERVIRRLESPLSVETLALLAHFAQQGRVIGSHPVTEDETVWMESVRVAPWSYPYEWTKSQLADAALLTLQLTRDAVERGFCLKDATPFNVQFEGAVPVFIDLLSFEPRTGETPWVAYHQFCAEFLGPLALAHYLGDNAAQRLTSAGVALPLQTISRCLPARSWLRPAIFLHLHLHARMGASARATRLNQTARLSRRALLAMLESLEHTVGRLRDTRTRTYWQNYYGTLPGYSDAGFEQKRNAVAECLQRVGRVNLALDLGCNTGLFSRLLSEYADKVVAVDSDAGAVDVLYRQLAEEKNRVILPLCQNVLSPSAALGWQNQERGSFFDRVKPDLTLALALVHHLAISGGIALADILAWLSGVSRHVVIEWVPPEDIMADQLLNQMPHSRSRYRTDLFLEAVHRHFEIQSQTALSGSARTLFLLRRK